MRANGPLFYKAASGYLWQIVFGVYVRPPQRLAESHGNGPVRRFNGMIV